MDMYVFKECKNFHQKLNQSIYLSNCDTIRPKNIIFGAKVFHSLQKPTNELYNTRETHEEVVAALSHQRSP